MMHTQIMKLPAKILLHVHFNLTFTVPELAHAPQFLCQVVTQI